MECIKEQCERCGRWVKLGYIETHKTTLLCIRGGSVHPSLIKMKYNKSEKGKASMKKAKIKYKNKEKKNYIKIKTGCFEVFFD